MRYIASDLIATVAIALLLAGVNEENPHRYHCLAVAALLAMASYALNKGRT